MPDLPVCWCGDPGTYALDALHPSGVGTDEARYVWEVPTWPKGTFLVVTRCRAHAGPFAAEVTDGTLTLVTVHPLGDHLPWEAPA